MLDSELGLVYYNHRHYNSKDGRWLSRDPLGEEASINLYEFSKSNPVNFFDSLGLSCVQLQNPDVGKPMSFSPGVGLLLSASYGFFSEYEACCVECSDGSKGYEVSGKTGLEATLTAEMATYSFFAQVSNNWGPFAGSLSFRVWGGVRIYGQVSAKAYISYGYRTCPNDNIIAEGAISVTGSLGIEIGGEAYVRGTVRLNRPVLGFFIKKTLTVGVGIAVGGRLGLEWTPSVSCSTSGCILDGPIKAFIEGTARARVLATSVEFSVKEEFDTGFNQTVIFGTFLPLPIAIIS